MAGALVQEAPARLAVTGISHVVVAAGDVAAAVGFYRDVVGLDAVKAGDWWDGMGGAVLVTERGQHVVLADTPPMADLAASARHVAFRVSPAGRDRILAAARAQGIELFDYHEDRPSERGDNLYLHDPAGNRVQIVARDGVAGDGIAAIDHLAIETNDAIWAEEFYGRWFGWPVEFRMGWNTQDYTTAKARGEAGMREAMPGARYWNERYSPFETEKKALRPNPQQYFQVGEAVVAVYLAARHYEAPSDRLIKGAPRTGLATEPGGLDALAHLLEAKDVAFEGPVSHGAGHPITRSLFVRDPGGNFLEFSEAL